MPTEAIFNPPRPGQLGQLAAQLDHVRARIDNRLADFRAELDHRLVHLRLDLLFERDFAAFENFLNVRPQLARLRIDDREFLLDAEGEGVVFGAHDGYRIPSKTTAVIPSRDQTAHFRT